MTAREDEATTLRRLVARRLNTRDMADELGCTQQQVKSRLRKHGLSTEYRKLDPARTRKKPGLPKGAKLGRCVERAPSPLTLAVSPRSIRAYELAPDRERALFAPHVVAAAERLGVR